MPRTQTRDPCSISTQHYKSLAFGSGEITYLTPKEFGTWWDGEILAPTGNDSLLTIARLFLTD